MSVLVAGVACGYSGPLAIAGAAAGWDQEVLAGHGCRRNPVTGLHEPPSASTLGRLPALVDADELEAGLSAWAAPAALDPQLAARITARAAAGKKAGGGKKKRRRDKKPPAGEALRETRAGGLVRAAPGHPWLDPAIIGDPGHRPARPAVGVDGKERKLAKAGGKKKAHLLAAVTHVTGLVIGQESLSNSLCKPGQSLSFCYITVGSFRCPGQTGTRSGNVTANAFMAAFQPRVPVPRCPLSRTSPSPSMWRPVTFLIPR